MSQLARDIIKCINFVAAKGVVADFDGSADAGTNLGDNLRHDHGVTRLAGTDEDQFRGESMLSTIAHRMPLAVIIVVVNEPAHINKMQARFKCSEYRQRQQERPG
ncbi:MAG TPA: hypothetical protein VGB55_10480 [Tepidisphaeraceae bacterium]